MEYKTNIVLNNSQNKGEMLTFIYNTKKELSKKQQRTINLLITDTFTSKEDIMDIENLNKLLKNKKPIRLNYYMNDFVKDLKNELKSKGVGLKNIESRNIFDWSSDRFYDLNSSDNNTVVLNSTYDHASIGYYDPESNRFLNEEKYNKKGYFFSKNDLHEYNDLSLYGENLEMFEGLFKANEKNNNPLKKLKLNNLDSNLGYIWKTKLKPLLKEIEKKEIENLSIKDIIYDDYIIDLGKGSKFVFDINFYLDREPFIEDYDSVSEFLHNCFHIKKDNYDYTFKSGDPEYFYNETSFKDSVSVISEMFDAFKDLDNYIKLDQEPKEKMSKSKKRKKNKI